ncbi:hypothetical protein NQ176_g1511 [Zarea fungicola]|uniref:Uncharacterized protein n=1 Tax=Zarea fungicola TaxID=93591 RepID=A0ACC1NSE3_9HYPO|nr:hypothetical protein NQ176_g1511 [Lecanicillium fungicola]
MPVAEFAQLPNDVLLVLVDILSDSTINALAQTSHRFYATFNYALYSHNAHQCSSLALQWAAFHGVVGTVKKALAAGADPNSRRMHPHNKHFDVSHRHIYETSAAGRSIPYHTSLTIAASGGRLQIASLLIAAGASVDVVPWKNHDNAPLLAAIQGDHIEMAKLLISTGKIHFNSLVKYGINILTHAVASSSIELIRYILGGVKDADLHQPMKPTPLILAVQNQRLDVIMLLLDSKNVTPALVDDRGLTALAWAAVTTSDATGSVFRLLLDSGQFDPNITDRQGRTAISLAAGVGNHVVVSLLLALPNIDPNIVDREGLAPIFHALPHKDVMNTLMTSSKVTIPVDALFRFASEK